MTAAVMPVACVSHCCHASVLWHKRDRVFVCERCKRETMMVFQPPYRGGAA